MTGPPLAWTSALAAMAALAMPLIGCGAETQHANRVTLHERSDAPVYQHARWGYGVRVPDSWSRAADTVSTLADPREILALATFPLPHHRSTDCEAFAGSARSQMGRADVVLTVQERGFDRDSGWSDFPPRPESFGPSDPRPGEPGCGDPPGAIVYWRNFSDAGRHFHTLVVVGPDTPSSALTQTWDILDSLHFDHDHRPTWPASP